MRKVVVCFLPYGMHVARLGCLELTAIDTIDQETAEIDATSPLARNEPGFPASKGIGCLRYYRHASIDRSEFNGAQGRRTTRRG